MGDLSACNKPIRYNAEINAGTTDVSVRACTIDDADSISERSAAASTKYTKRTTTKDVDFHIAKNTNGTRLSREEVDLFVKGIDSKTLKNMSPGTSFAIIVSVSDRDAAMGIFAHRGVHPPSVLPLVQEFGLRDMNGTSMHIAQHCGEGVPRDETVGVIFDTSQRDINDMVSAWGQGKCVTNYQAEEDWEGVPVDFRETE